MSFLDAIIATPLLQKALLACLGASLSAGIIGTYVVVKRIVSLSGSIAHSVMGGMGMMLWLQRTLGFFWLLPIFGALLSAILSAIIIGWVHLRFREREDAVISMIWSLGMAIGVIFISKTPGFSVELTHFLLGNILWITTGDLAVLALLNLVILTFVLMFHSRFLAICFDEKQAELQGIRVRFFYLFLLILVALAVVVLLYIVGIILALAMLALPASIALAFTRKISTTMIVATLLNILFCVGGLALSYHLNWPAGATIALFAGLGYLTSLRLKPLGQLILSQSSSSEGDKKPIVIPQKLN